MFNLRKIFSNTADGSGDEAEAVQLDGSNMARLINMRVARAKKCECQRCADLLSRIHFNGGLTLNEHEGELKGVRFWTRSVPEDYEAPFGFHVEPTIGEIALEQVNHPALLVSTFVSAEREWQAADKESCTDLESDRFWLNHYQDLSRTGREHVSNATEGAE